MAHYVDSEVGRLETVITHRPGPELTRLTPRNTDSLLFDGIPWVARAQEEHDAFVAVLRGRDIEVLYLADLLTDVLTMPDARDELIRTVTDVPRLGDALRRRVIQHLRYLDPVGLTGVLIGGLAYEELHGSPGLVYRMMNRHEFIIDPLPNLLFTRDSSAWIGDQVAVTSLAMPARARESALTSAIYRYHPRFAGTTLLYQPHLEHLEGGDVLLLGPGVLAVGVGERTMPSGAERLARRVFAAGLAHTVLVTPVTQRRATMHLDTILTMVDTDTVVMYPPLADTLLAYRVVDEDGEPRVEAPRPLVAVAAQSLGIERLTVLGTGLDPVTAEREQWDDGNNTLALAPRVCLAYERNQETNRQLERAGIEVIPLPSSELSTGRGGPRCMSCPIARAPASPRGPVSAG